jgi:hypothetical protein
LNDDSCFNFVAAAAVLVSSAKLVSGAGDGVNAGE